MKSAIWLKHAAEVWSRSKKYPGPTGRFAEVVRGEVQDYGGNVLFTGSADACVAERKKWRIPTRLVPVEWREVAGDVAGSDWSWQMVIEQEATR